MFATETCAVAAAELIQVHAGRDHRERRGNSVAREHVGHLLARNDQMIDVLTQLFGEPARAEAQQRRRKPRQIVRGVLLEKRVVTLDNRTAEPASELVTPGMP